MVVPKTRNGNESRVAAKILRAAAKGLSLEEIHKRCQLAPAVLANYLVCLTQLRLLKVEGETSYRTTKEGLQFLSTYHSLRWLLWGRDNDLLLMRLLGQLTNAEKDKHLFYVS